MTSQDRVARSCLASFLTWVYSSCCCLQIQRHICYPKEYFYTGIYSLSSDVVGSGLHLLSSEPICQEFITGFLKPQLGDHMTNLDNLSSYYYVK